MTAGEPTFAIEVWLDYGTDPKVPNAEGSRKSTGTLPSGSSYVRYESDARVSYVISWSVPDPKPCPPDAFCTQELRTKPATLYVNIVGIRGNDYWPAFLKDAEAMAQSIDRFEIVVRPGYTAPGVQEDGFTKILAAFMNARGSRSGAERYMTETAILAYERSTAPDRLRLYSTESSDSHYGAFKIHRRIENQDDLRHPAFIVSMEERTGTGDLVRTVYERIEMGPGLNTAGEEFGAPYEGLVTGASFCDEACVQDNGIAS